MRIVINKMTGVLAPLMLAACVTTAETADNPDNLPVVKLSPPVLHYVRAGRSPVTYHMGNSLSGTFATVMYEQHAVFVRDKDDNVYSYTCKDLDRLSAASLIDMIRADTFEKDNKARAQLREYQLGQDAINCPRIKV